VNLNDLDPVSNPATLPAAPRALHVLAVQHHLPFLIAAVPTDPDHYGLLIEVAEHTCGELVAEVLRDIADDLSARHEQHEQHA